MKLPNMNAAVEVAGGDNTSTFSIALNGKAFKVLSDTLYQDKIGSIVRELSCNAYDAHVSNGNSDVPFEIHLPDAFEPWFAVKDFGIGLSDEDVRSVFTVYFQSTKDQSNDSIGSFGLGAKTPFSYTDQFTVTSVKNGTRTIYSAYLTESGIPNITVMFSEETTEPSGVEIKVSVKREDFYKFKSAVEAQLKYFETKPNIINGEVTWPAESDIIYNDSNCSLGGSNLIIIQGQVGYPLNLETLNGKISDSTHAFLKRIRSYGLTMKFDIGEIGVTASREGIEYTAFTCKNIESKVQEIEAALKNHYEQELNDCKSNWEKAAKINSNALLKTMLSGYAVTGVTKSHYGTFSFDLQNKLGKLYFVNKQYVNPKVNKQPEKLIAPTIHPTVVFVRDKITQVNQKIKELCRKYEYIYEYTPDVASKNPRQDIADALGGFSNVVFMSEYELPKEVNPSVRTRSTIAKYWECINFNTNPQNWNKQFDSIGEIDCDFYYVVLDRLDFKDMKDANDMRRLNYLKDYESATIIGIRESALGTVQGMKNAKPLSVLVEFLEEKYKNTGLASIYRKIEKVNHIQGLIGYSLKNFLNVIKTDVKEHKYVKLVQNLDKKYDELGTNAKLAESVHWFLHKTSSAVSYSRYTEKYKKLESKFFNDFPMMKAYETYNFKLKISDAEVENYMNMVYNSISK